MFAPTLHNEIEKQQTQIYTASQRNRVHLGRQNCHADSSNKLRRILCSWMREMMLLQLEFIIILPLWYQRVHFHFSSR